MIFSGGLNITPALHGLYVQQATSENLLYVEDNGKDPIDDCCRWLSFRSSKPEHFDICNKFEKAGSVLCLNEDGI